LKVLHFEKGFSLAQKFYPLVPLNGKKIIILAVVLMSVFTFAAMFDF